MRLYGAYTSRGLHNVVTQHLYKFVLGKTVDIAIAKNKYSIVDLTL